MPSPIQQTQAIVLGRKESGESYWHLNLFSAIDGPLPVLLRKPSAKRSPKLSIPDLFDQIDVQLQGGRQGKSYFVEDLRILKHNIELAHHYQALIHASQFAHILWRNLTHAEHFEPIHTLLLQALEAFSQGVRPEVVHLKALYLFAREEGYPVREHWIATLPAALAKDAKHALSNPPNGDQPPSDKTENLLHLLQHYLKSHTDILI